MECLKTKFIDISTVIQVDLQNIMLPSANTYIKRMMLSFFNALFHVRVLTRFVELNEIQQCYRYSMITIYLKTDLQPVVVHICPDKTMALIRIYIHEMVHFQLYIFQLQIPCSVGFFMESS